MNCDILCLKLDVLYFYCDSTLSCYFTMKPQTSHQQAWPHLHGDVRLVLLQLFEELQAKTQKPKDR